MIRSIQYMRAIAALLVVFHHAAWKAHQHSSDPWSAFRVGEAGVDLFFIISGFIMCEATSRRPIAFGPFMKARALRILPLYWLLTTVAWAAYAIAPRFVNSGEPASVLASYLLLPSHSRYLLQNGWTLSYEFLFYAIFGLGLAWRGAARHALPVALLVIAWAVGFIGAPESLFARYLTHPSLLEFAMGIASYHLLRRLRFTPALAIGLLLLGTLGLWLANTNGMGVNRALSFGLPCWAVFLGIAASEPWLARAAGHPLARGLQAVGDSSYSLYLVHLFVLGGSVFLFGLTPLPRAGHLYASALVVTSVVGGVVCYRGLEQPLARWLKRGVVPTPSA